MDLPIDNYRDSTPFFLERGDVGVLLIHGFSGTPGEVRLLGDHLAERGFTVAAPLLSGHGGGQEHLASSSRRDWVRSAASALDALRSHRRAVIPVGFSMGGSIALQLAARRDVAAVVAISTPSHLANRAVRLLLPAARLVVPYLYPLRRVDLTRPEVRERVRTYMPDLQFDTSNPADAQRLRRTVKISVSAVHQLSLLLSETEHLLPRIDAPTLLLQANDDEQIPAASLDLLYGAIGAADRRALRFDDAGHMLPVGPRRSAVFDAIGSFLEDVTRR